MRPEGARCTTRWRERRVTSTSNERSSCIGVEVNRILYHSGDIRRLGLAALSEVEEARPTRNRTSPLIWLTTIVESGDIEMTVACGLCADLVAVGGVQAV